jgi:DNA-binding MarR family transcriptional regulator
LIDRKSPRRRKSINFRVHALASSLFKGAQQFYGARFGVGIPEMRIVSNLDSEGPLTATQLVGLTVMDKALVSRILNALHARGLLSASPSASDPRRRRWALSRAGRQLVDRLRPMWRQREAIIQAGLSAAEHDLLEELLERLFLASEALRAEEARLLRAEQAAHNNRRRTATAAAAAHEQGTGSLARTSGIG